MIFLGKKAASVCGPGESMINPYRTGEFVDIESDAWGIWAVVKWDDEEVLDKVSVMSLKLAGDTGIGVYVVE